MGSPYFRINASRAGDVPPTRDDAFSCFLLFPSRRIHVPRAMTSPRAQQTDVRRHGRRRGSAPRRFLRLCAVLALLVVTIASGCVTPIPKTRFNAADLRFEIDRRSGPTMSANASQILRENGITSPSNEEDLATLRGLLELSASADLVYAYAEAAYLTARRLEKSNPDRAAGLYADVVRYTWNFLFNPTLAKAHERASWNGELADVVLLYNGASERFLHLALVDAFKGNDAEFPFRHEESAEVAADVERLRVYSVFQPGSWRPDEYEEFRVAADCAVNALSLDCRQSGVGVPLVVQRRTSEKYPRPEEKYYPPAILFPATAILRPNPAKPVGALPPVDPTLPFDPSEPDFTLDVYDPLSVTDFSLNGSSLPLEADFTTPIAYFLTTHDKLNTRAARQSLLRPESLQQTFEVAGNQERQLQGLYMLEPYNPDKIPVVMSHGLASSPATWMEMYNALRSVQGIREGFQFWFFFYPTGQPFWASAATLRHELPALRDLVDPTHEAEPLDNAVLIGHSMGGLISRMQTQSSEDKLWKLVSSRPVDDFNFDEEARRRIDDWFFFEPNPDVKRVVTIATPFRGSDFANSFTTWLADHAIAVPKAVGAVLACAAPKRMKGEEDLDPTLLNISTSVQSLDPDCPVFRVLDDLEIPDDVALNNIIGVMPQLERRPFGPKKSDGVVDYSSSHRDDVESETETPASHVAVHAHFDTLDQTRNILARHLALYRQRHEPRTAPGVTGAAESERPALPASGYLSVAPSAASNAIAATPRTFAEPEPEPEPPADALTDAPTTGRRRANHDAGVLLPVISDDEPYEPAAEAPSFSGEPDVPAEGTSPEPDAPDKGPRRRILFGPRSD